MKKFLFTLATLLMAGTTFAANYAYIDDVELTPDQLGKPVILQVKVHADVAFNAYTFNFTFDGDMTHEAYAEPDEDHGAFEIPYYNAQGKARTAMVVDNCMGDVDKGLACFCATAGYWQDPNGENPNAWVSYGAVKWMPQEEDYQFYYITITPSENFTGGTITLDGNFSAGADARDIPVAYPDIVYFNNQVCHITVEQSQPEFVGTADVTFNENVATLTYTSNDPGANVEVKVGETVTTVEWTYDEETKTYTATYEAEKSDVPGTHSVTVTLTVTPSDNYTGEEVSDSDTYTYTVNDELKGDIELGDVTEDGKVTVTYTGDEEGVELAVVVKDKDGNVVENAYADGVITLPDYGEYTVTVTASATGYNNKDFDPETVKWEKPEFEGTADVTFNENVATLTYTSNDPEATVEVKVGETVTTVEWTYDEATKTYTATYEAEKSAVPGTHSVTVTLTVTPSENYTGEPASDSDTYTYTVNDELKGDIELGDVTEDGKVTVTYTGDEEGVVLAVVVKDKDGNVVEGAYTDGVITLPDYGEYTVTVTASAAGYNDKDFDPETVKWEKKDAQMPTIEGANLTDATYDIVITPDPNTDGALEYTATPAAPGKAAAETLTYERKDADYTVHVEAWTNEGPTYKKSEVAKADIVIPAKDAPKVYEVADPTITVDNSDPTKTVITIEATEGNLTYTLTEDGEPFTEYTVEVVDGKTVITIENGDEVKTVNVTATTTLDEIPDGFDEVQPGKAEETVQTPIYQQPQTAAPTIDVSFDGEEGHYYANVTFKNDPADPNAVIEYCLGDPTVEENWLPYTGAPVVITEDGSYTVYARATATGKATSEVADRTFELNQTATSVNELVNGKTVAGVRYFNMAGQEMQEANGITIVVTTYTDGTTSAVKVMK